MTQMRPYTDEQYRYVKSSIGDTLGSFTPSGRIPSDKIIQIHNSIQVECSESVRHPDDLSAQVNNNEDPQEITK